MAINVAYALVENDLFGILNEELTGETGETKTRRTQAPNMVERDVLDEDGQPTGETVMVQDGWIRGGEDGTETEVVNVSRGGWKFFGNSVESATGEVWRGVRMWSPRLAEVRTVADAYPSKLIALMIHDADDAPPWDEDFTADQTVNAAALLVKQYYDNNSIPYDQPANDDDVGKLNFVITHPAMGLDPVTGTTNDEIIRQGILPQLRS